MARLSVARRSSTGPGGQVATVTRWSAAPTTATPRLDAVAAVQPAEAPERRQPRPGRRGRAHAPAIEKSAEADASLAGSPVPSETFGNPKVAT